MSDMNNPADDNNGAMDDLWAEALSEQKSTSSKSAADAVFQQFGGGDVSGTLQDIDGFPRIISGISHGEISQVLNTLREKEHFKFTTFDDVDDATIAE